ncbi:MAG TPA: hypothetical protein VJO34_01385 [Methylomirabilota bacterium]|nr:hypothetical protein [Methylomirabilota bacterium]
MDFDFGQHTKVKDLNVVPEQFRPLYGESEEGFSLRSTDPTVKGAVEAIVGLNRALKAARAEAKNKGSMDLSPLQEWGSDPATIAEAVKARIAEFEEMATKGSKAKLDIEKIKADLAKAHVGETEKVTRRAEALQKQLYTVMVESTAKSAIAEAKGDVDLLLPFVTGKIVVKEEDGAFKVYVVDGSQSIRYSGVTGEPMTIKELVGEMKAAEKYGKLFVSEAPSGGGTPPSGPVGGSRILPGGKELSSTEKISMGLKKGQFASQGGFAK